MWSDIIFLLFLFYYTSNGQIEQASVAKQRQKLLGGKQTLIGGKKLLALHAKKAVIEEALKKSPQRWPDGQVKYYIDENSYDKTMVSKLLETAFAAVGADAACPEFILLSEKPTGDSDGSWLHFTNPDRVRPCVHEPGGTAPSEQGEIVVVLGYDCLTRREILHTVMHGLGFPDEVTHPRRDLFVRIMWNDIQPAFRSMFKTRSMEKAELNYDPKSIMHFHDHAYSLTGNPSIAPLQPGLTIEPPKGLSDIDKMKIRLMFAQECKKREITKLLHSCSTNNGDNNDDNGNYNDGGNGNNNGGGKVLIPGNDVTGVMPDYGGKDDVQVDGDASKVVIQGNDVAGIEPDLNPQDESDAAGGNDNSGNAGNHKVVVPGNDVSSIDGIADEVVVEGDNVKLSGETDGK